MVTTAEFIRHVATSAIVMGVGLAAVTHSRFRWNTAHRSFRRFVLTYIGLVALIAMLSRISNVSDVRCVDDKTQWCRFNDTVPAMATIAVVYLIAGLVRSRTMYTRR